MRKLTWLFALSIPVLVLSCQKDAVQTQSAQGETALAKTTGNDAPSGAHYNLNIIGVPHDKTADMTGDNGGRIFVPLNQDGVSPKSCKIMLTQAPTGESFQVLDANGTDGTAAFQLPGDVSTSYTVWGRALGKPGTAATITTCADSVLTSDGYEYAALDCQSITITRSTTNKFVNVSSDLLYVTILSDYTASDGTVIPAGTYPLFDPALAGYFWQYDNNGLKILQLRFYQNAQ